MSVFNEREKQIIDYLMDGNNYTSIELAQLLNITSRTVKSDIQHISRILSGNGAFIESKRGVGYRLFITSSVLFNQFTKQIKDTSFKNIPTSKQERSIYIVQRLLTLNNPILINDLADEIYVSRQTILNELKDIKIILNNYSLDLKSSNEGIFIYGDEIQKRRCLNEFFSK